MASRGIQPARSSEDDDSARGKASGSANSARAEARGSGDSARAQARGSLIAHRQIVGDIGRDVGTEAEYRRADALAVALTAGKRLSEALRAIEEYGKVVDPNFAAAIEQTRYRGYELERRLTLTAATGLIATDAAIGSPFRCSSRSWRTERPSTYSMIR